MSKHLGSSGAIWSKLDEFQKVFHFNAQSLWNYSKSQKSKFQIDLTATVFELDTSFGEQKCL